jgi:hypothetical protein
MSREAHVQFCESLGVRFPGATHLFAADELRAAAFDVGECAKSIML